MLLLLACAPGGLKLDHFAAALLDEFGFSQRRKYQSFNDFRPKKTHEKTRDFSRPTVAVIIRYDETPGDFTCNGK